MNTLDEGTEITNESLDTDSKEKSTLTDWANEPSISELKQDYTDASSDLRIHIDNVDRWLENLNIKGKAKLPVKKGRSSIVPKLIRKQAEWRYASLSEPFLSTDDIFNVDPITYEDKHAAVQNSLVLNNQLNTKIDKIRFIDEYVRTSVDEGTVIARVGWEFQEEEVEVPTIQPVPTNDPAAVQQLQQLMQMAQQAPDQVPPEMQESIQMTMQTNVPHMPQQVGTHMEMKTIKNHPTVEVCDYRRISIDPLARGDINQANFVIFDFETSLSDLEKEGKYINLDKINTNVSNVLSLRDENIEQSFNFKDKPRKRFMAHEYWGEWDIDGTGITKPIIVTYVENTIIRMEENPFPDKKHPFVAVQYLPVRRSIYGEPDGELLEDNQKIIGAVTRGMIDIMARSANAQTGTRKDALDLTNKRKYERGEDYEFNGGVDPRQGFFMHTFGEIPRSAEYMLNQQHNEAESLTGVKAFSGDGGISGKALGTTATGIRSALDATSKRELGILRRLAEGMKQIGRKIISMNAVFLDEEEVIRITNEEFVEVRRDDLQGNFDLSLTISTAEADNQKAEELAFMLQTTAQSMGPEFTQIILSDISKLRKMPALAKKIEQYQPQPDPIAQEKAQLENEMLKAEIAEKNAKAQQAMASAQLDMARIGTEGAKAGNIASDTDQKNLDFIEQEGGTKHARNMQQDGAQARANMDLKVVEHSLKVNEDKPAKV